MNRRLASRYTQRAQAPVADLKRYHRQVRLNGLVVPDLSVTFYGLTEFRISDPDGNRLWIGQSRATEV